MAPYTSGMLSVVMQSLITNHIMCVECVRDLVRYPIVVVQDMPQEEPLTTSKVNRKDQMKLQSRLPTLRYLN